MIKYYPFELHTHTNHSDGSMSPKTLVTKAKQRGLTGIAITDHNTKSSLPSLIKYGREYDLTIISGIEWTTFYGHITILGGKSNVDWRSITLDNINSKFKEVVASGDIINIAHPKRLGSPVCAGCSAVYTVEDYNDISGYEVWSNPKPSFSRSNQLAYTEYNQLTDKGYKIAVVHGDDWHDERNNRKQYASTYLGIDGEVNAESAVNAIRARRTYISTGLQIIAHLSNGDKHYNIGEVIGKGSYKLSVEVDNDNEYCSNHKVEPKVIRLLGVSLDREIIIDNNKVVIDNLNVNKGHFRIEIAGNIDGEYTTLLITSPYYVEVLC